MNATFYALVLGKVKSVYEGKVVTGRLISDMVLCCVHMDQNGLGSDDNLYE